MEHSYADGIPWWARGVLLVAIVASALLVLGIQTAHLLSHLASRLGRRVHLCVDHSNITIGLLEASPPGTTLDYRALRAYMVSAKGTLLSRTAHCLGRGVERPVGICFSAGSFRRGGSPGEIWRRAEEAGFTVKTFERVGVHGQREQGVDEVIHYAMSRAMREAVRSLNTLVSTVTCRRCWARDCIAVATGDGNENDGISSFVTECREALLDGLDVEVYAFRKSLSGNFKRLAEEQRRKSNSCCRLGRPTLTIHLLDDVVTSLRMPTPRTPHAERHRSRPRTGAGDRAGSGARGGVRNRTRARTPGPSSASTRQRSKPRSPGGSDHPMRTPTSSAGATRPRSRPGLPASSGQSSRRQGGGFRTRRSASRSRRSGR